MIDNIRPAVQDSYEIIGELYAVRALDSVYNDWYPEHFERLSKHPVFLCTSARKRSKIRR
jgi:hypothetical protein